MAVEQQSKQVENKVNKQQRTHLHVQQQACHNPKPVAQAVETFDFNPRQHENPPKLYATPFDAHQDSEEVDLFGQQPFSSANGKVRIPSRGSSHSPSPPVETDAFGSFPFVGGPKEMSSKQNGPVPSKASSNKQLDQFGLEPFASGLVTKHSKTTASSNSGNQLVQESFTSSPTDQFGHAPFVVTENKLFRQSDSFHSSSSNTSFSPSRQSPPISASCSEDLLITNRR